MPTEVIRLGGETDYRESLRRAAKFIREGKLVGFPTETVYGVAARGDSPEAVTALRHAKRGRGEKPFTVHIGRPKDVHRFVPVLSGIARRLIDRGWPGPLTLVFPVENVSLAPVASEPGCIEPELMYKEGSVGVRCPSAQTASDLLAEADVPVVAASANRAGEPPPNSGQEVLAALGADLALLLDDGVARYARPSTVVALTDGDYRVLREGVVDARTLEGLATLTLLFVCSGNTCRSPMAEALCRQLMAERLGCSVADLPGRHVVVNSASGFGGSGASASPEAKEVLRRRGIDLSGHVSQALTAELIDQADYVFCMTRSHVATVVSLVPSAREKTRLLADDEEIQDPLGGGLAEYERCARSMEAAVSKRLAEIEL